MSFKVLIIEDEALFADQLEMLIDKLGYELLGITDNSTAALQLMEVQVPDLILMDIHIRGKHDGIELADLIHQQKFIPIIFITSMQDDLTFARASRTNPVNFLLKPFNDIQLQRSIELTVQQLNQQTTSSESDKTTNKQTEAEWENDFLFADHFFIKTRQQLEKLAVNDVIYLEADGHYCRVHTHSKKFLVRMSMVELLKRLPAKDFVQTHRSYLVNINKVESVDLKENEVILAKHRIPLSKRNRDPFLKKLDWI